MSDDNTIGSSNESFNELLLTFGAAAFILAIITYIIYKFYRSEQQLWWSRLLSDINIDQFRTEINPNLLSGGGPTITTTRVRYTPPNLLNQNLFSPEFQNLISNNLLEEPNIGALINNNLQRPDNLESIRILRESSYPRSNKTLEEEKVDVLGNKDIMFLQEEFKNNKLKEIKEESAEKEFSKAKNDLENDESDNEIKRSPRNSF